MSFLFRWYYSCWSIRFIAWNLVHFVGPSKATWERNAKYFFVTEYNHTCERKIRTSWCVVYLSMSGSSSKGSVLEWYLLNGLPVWSMRNFSKFHLTSLPSRGSHHRSGLGQKNSQGGGQASWKQTQWLNELYQLKRYVGTFKCTKKGWASSPLTLTFHVRGNFGTKGTPLCMPGLTYFMLLRISVAFSPGSCRPNWWQGNARMSKASSLYLSARAFSV